MICTKLTINYVPCSQNSWYAINLKIMEKILVTTDLSANSKPGIRFAMQLAKQRNAELIILHVFYVLKATSWSDTTYKTYFKRTEKKLQKDLASFMRAIKRAPNTPKVSYRIELEHAMDTVESILAYAEKEAITYRSRDGPFRPAKG
jgi:nucleotide-binding universal stress UspA family protein